MPKGSLSSSSDEISLRGSAVIQQELMEGCVAGGLTGRWSEWFRSTGR
jgi:hypothetical protein